MAVSKFNPTQPAGVIGRDELAGLLRQVATKDKDAFAALYTATSAKLFGVVLRILRQRQVAEEVLQEVYLRVWDRAGDFDATRASPVTWMCAIARNRALDEVRKVAPRYLEDLPGGFEAASDAPLALDVLTEIEDGQRLHDCLQRLDPQKRDMVVQAYMEGASREDLSRRFGAPVATIKTWLHRSLSQLKDCLGS